LLKVSRAMLKWVCRGAPLVCTEKSYRQINIFEIEFQK